MTYKQGRLSHYDSPIPEPIEGPPLLALEKQRHINALAEAVRQGDLAAVCLQRKLLVREGFMSEAMVNCVIDKIIEGETDD